MVKSKVHLTEEGVTRLEFILGEDDPQEEAEALERIIQPHVMLLHRWLMLQHETKQADKRMGAHAGAAFSRRPCFQPEFGRRIRRWRRLCNI